MPIDLNNIWVFRIMPVQNLESILKVGLFCRTADRGETGYVCIGSQEVIDRRDRTEVKCFRGTYVNDYVPFYFSVRTPMLYNIITGRGVKPVPQQDIIYLCFKLHDLASGEFQWCYTNGNAATAITKFFTNLDEIESNLDWHSIYSTDFRGNNADSDYDRIRKKHSELLVRDHVPASKIGRIVVLNSETALHVQQLVDRLHVDIEVLINPKKRFYFL